MFKYVLKYCFFLYKHMLCKSQSICPGLLPPLLCVVFVMWSYFFTGESVIKLTASDNDTSAPNNIIFFVLDSGGFDNFRVNSTSGLVTVGPGAKLDREKEDNFQLSVLVLDRGDPPRSSSATVSVFLLDINDEPPTFGAAQGEREVAENSTVGDTVLVMTATDPDTDHLLTYELLKNETQAFNDRLLHVNNKEVWVSHPFFSFFPFSIMCSFVQL